MCGIYGYIGKCDAYIEVLNGLSRLQYRGYDSCGIAYFDKGFKINKAIGTLDNLPQTLECTPIIAFGHTRWATNGEVNIVNTHPHTSYDKEFVLVHNGIIKNSDKLKKELIEKGISFYSDTDTEVIVNLIASLSGKIEKRLEKLYKILDGSFSLMFVAQKQNQSLQSILSLWLFSFIACVIFSGPRAAAAFEQSNTNHAGGFIFSNKCLIGY